MNERSVRHPDENMRAEIPSGMGGALSIHCLCEQSSVRGAGQVQEAHKLNIGKAYGLSSTSKTLGDRRSRSV